MSAVEGRGDGGAGRAAQREQAVLWVLRSASEFCKCDRTVHLAVAILDRVVRLHTPPSEAAAVTDGTGSWTELLGIAALLLACKFQEVRRSGRTPCERGALPSPPR